MIILHKVFLCTTGFSLMCTKCINTRQLTLASFQESLVIDAWQKHETCFLLLQKQNSDIFCRGAIFWCSLAEKNWQFCITVTKKMHPSGEKLQISENPELLLKVQQLLQLISGVDRCYGVVWVTINALPGCCDGIVHWMIHTV